MFEDSFVANLIIFALGQAAAYGYLRTGLRARGVAVMVIGWVLVDVALMETLAFDRRSTLFYAALGTMQIHALAEFFLFFSRRLHRRRASYQVYRDQRARQAVIHFIRNECEAARRCYSELMRRDPWDLQANIALATVLSRLGKTRRSRALFRRARVLDVKRRYDDVIDYELARFRGMVKRSRRQADRSSAPPQAVTPSPR